MIIKLNSIENAILDISITLIAHENFVFFPFILLFKNLPIFKSKMIVFNLYMTSYKKGQNKFCPQGNNL